MNQQAGYHMNLGESSFERRITALELIVHLKPKVV